MLASPDDDEDEENPPLPRTKSKKTKGATKNARASDGDWNPEEDDDHDMESRRPPTPPAGGSAAPTDMADNAWHQATQVTVPARRNQRRNAGKPAHSPVTVAGNAEAGPSKKKTRR